MTMLIRTAFISVFACFLTAAGPATRPVNSGETSQKSKSAATQPVIPRAARSVHLAYIAPKVDALYVEMVIEKSSPGSYFQACGFSGGYFGLQELASGKKVAIFSVWDSGHSAKTDQPTKVDPADQTLLIDHAESVRVHRFGGEGTGMHCDWDFDWKIDQPYRLYLKSQIKDQRTQYTAYIGQSGSTDWFKAATFSSPNGGKSMTGLYSFIEDFKRDTNSANQTRRARFRHVWGHDLTDQWIAITRARFTASGAGFEAKDTINAGAIDPYFFLQTGGKTLQTTALKTVMTRQLAKDETAPIVP